MIRELSQGTNCSVNWRKLWKKLLSLNCRDIKALKWLVAFKSSRYTIWMSKCMTAFRFLGQIHTILIMPDVRFTVEEWFRIETSNAGGYSMDTSFINEMKYIEKCFLPTKCETRIHRSVALSQCYFISCHSLAILQSQSVCIKQSTNNIQTFGSVCQMHIWLEAKCAFGVQVKFKLFILCAAGAAVGNRRKMKEIRYNFGRLQHS